VWVVVAEGDHDLFDCVLLDERVRDAADEVDRRAG
jgi:hypothetical protein